MKALRLLLALTLAWLLCAPESRADAFGNRAWGKSEYQSVITPSDEAQTLVRYRENATGYDEIASGQEVWTKFDPLGEETESGYDYQDKIAQLKADRDNARIAQSEKDGEYGKADSPEAKAKAAALTKDENDARDKTMADDAKGKANLQATAKWARDHNIAVDESTLDDDTGHSSSVGPSISNILGVDSPRDPPTAGQAQYASIRGQMTAADLVEVGKQAAMMMVPGGEEENLVRGSEELYEATRAEAASERTAISMAKQIEKDLGPRARDAFHDAKDPGMGDRTMEQLKEDARALYEEAGKTPPKWMQ